jgi:hypothetical protein
MLKIMHNASETFTIPAGGLLMDLISQMSALHKESKADSASCKAGIASHSTFSHRSFTLDTSSIFASMCVWMSTSAAKSNQLMSLHSDTACQLDSLHSERTAQLPQLDVELTRFIPEAT